MARKRETKAQLRKRRGVDITSLEVQIDNFMSNCVDRNLREDTLLAYTHHLKTLQNYLAESDHRMMVEDITGEDIRGFISYLKNSRRLSQSSINSSIAHLKTFFNYLIQNEVLINSPMLRVSKGKVDSEPIIPFTHEQLRLLLKQPDKSKYTGFRDFCIMLLLADTGMRISELLELKTKDFSWNDDRVVLSKTKNRKARVIGISKNVKAELLRFKGKYLDDPNNDCEFFFQTNDGYQLKKRTFQDALKKYAAGANLTDVKVTCHNFRRYYAINYLKNGGSTGGLRSVLGHLTMQTVEKYLYWSDDDVVEQSNKYSPITNSQMLFKS